MKNPHDHHLNKSEFLLLPGEEKYKALVENSIHAYFLANTNGTILETNHIAMTMFGYSKNEFLSLNKQDLFDHTDENLILALEEQDRNKHVSVQATGIKKNGNHFPIELSSVIFTEPSGEVRTSIMVYDMSRLKYAAKNNPVIENNEIDLKSVIESITDGFFTLNNDWIITYWNKGVEKLSGIKKEQIEGKCFLNFFKDMEDLKFYSECRFAKQENRSVHFEEFYPTANSWIEVHAYPSVNGLTVFCQNISEQKAAEAALKLSNERFDMVVKATNDLVWDWDIITGEIYRNCEGVKRVYGHSSNENIKTNQLWAKNIHPLDRDRIDNEIAHYISSENESSFSFEYRFRREDGNYNYINDRGYITRNELGIVTRMIGAARDITEQKQTARNIEESEQRYKVFVQQSTEGIWRIELNEAKPITTPVEEMIAYCLTNGYLAECNDAFAQMYGYENAAKIIGIPLHAIMPADHPVSQGYLHKFITNNFKVENELSYEYDKDGNKLVFINNMVGIVENGFLQRAWGTKRNITEQKKTEASLQASEEQYRYLFDNNPSCIFIWDIDSLEILEVNKAAIELYGYSRNEFLQLSVLDIRPADEHPRFLEMVNSARQNQVYKRTKTWPHMNKRGERVFMEISSHNISYTGRRAVLAIGNNVTEKIQLENSLNEERQIRHKQITDAVITGQERERTELGEELHDNINQILASTRLYVECAIADEQIRKDLLDKGRILLDSAMKEIRKLSRSLLPPSLGEVSLLDALNDLTKDILLADQIEVNNHWENFSEHGLGEKLKLTIFRIVQEQLNNVLKHAKAKNVNISLSRNDEQICLVIKDDGIGFDTLSKRTGVGLRNITSRAEVNNGTVSIKSGSGEGCELSVKFMLNE